MTSDFYSKTQKMFKSCNRAFANIEAVDGPPKRLGGLHKPKASCRSCEHVDDGIS